MKGTNGKKGWKPEGKARRGGGKGGKEKGIKNETKEGIEKWWK